MHPVDQLAKKVFSASVALPFQRRVFDAISAGRSVVLQAPTGAGKTFAALAPFVLGAWGKGNGEPAQKLIYSLPLRVLAGSLCAQYRSLFPELTFTTQYGGAAEDVFLDAGDVIFTTIDQTLSAFIGVPLSVSQRLANAVFGSVLSGALVFDETHLLDPDKSFATALHLLRHSPWPVLIMTATMSTTLRKELCRLLKAEEIVVDAEDLPLIRSQHETRKHVTIASEPLQGQKLADQLGERTLVLCNRVGRAQEVYRDLCTELDQRGDTRRRMLLHSRYLPADRQAREAVLREWFGEGAQERAVLVATQVVEAGVDISCDVMHTEISPIDSFLQRIGRAARFANQREARIVVYPLAGMATANSYLPYQQATVLATLAAIEPLGVLTYDALQPLIDQILEPQQRNIVACVEKSIPTFERDAHYVRLTVDRNAIRQFIRAIDNIELVLAEPAVLAADSKRLFDYPAISVPLGTVRGFVRRGGQVYELLDGGGLQAAASTDIISNVRLIVSPAQATYDSELGLLLGQPGSVVFSPVDKTSTRVRYEYEEETYAEHLRRLLACTEVRAAPLAALHRLNNRTGSPTVRDPERVIALVIWAHDLAKLADGWQRAHGDHDRRASGAEPLAHGGRLVGQKPPYHAVEGAYAVTALLAQLLCVDAGEAKEVCYCALAAIRTHHSPSAWQHSSYRISPDRQAYLQRITPTLLPELGSAIVAALPRIRWSATGNEDFTWTKYPAGADYDPLFALLTYMLRRSDQLATSEVSRAVVY